ncbi:MAG: cytochrome c peroxidase [Caldilineaceae bacterium]
MQNLSAQVRGVLIFLGVSLVFVILMGLQDRSREPIVAPSTPRQPVEMTADEEAVADEVTEDGEVAVAEEATAEETAAESDTAAEATPQEGAASTFFAVLSTDPPVPEDNPQTPEKEELGKMLYFDPRLSQSSIISCATCHNLGLGGTDRIPTSLGHDFETGGRNAPTVLNAAFFNQQFWDGRAASLEEQAQGPIQAGVEMAMPPDLAVERINEISGYLPYFEAAFPGEDDPVSFDNIAKAIAAFERTLITPNDALDRYLQGDEAALSPLAIEGKQTFEAVGCVACHNGPMLSSGQLMPFRHGEDPGRMTVTGNPDDEFLFRVPTLRNLPLTAPYFHDGSAATIEDAIRTMGDVQLNRTLTDEEVTAISAFLNSLIGDQPQVTIPVLPTGDVVLPPNVEDVAELVSVVRGPFATLSNTPPIPDDNAQTAEKVALGTMLYFDPRLSQSSIISCATCHNLGLGGTDRIPTSLGHDFQTGGRNAPTVLNAAFFNQQFWDGRAATLEEQAQGPIQAGVEMAMPADLAVERMKSITGYLPYFEAAFPGEEDPITFDNIVKAISAFERTLITPNDALDRYLRGDETALSPEAIKGMETFQEVGCIGCHVGPMLSIGVLMPFRHGEDPGRMNVTGDPADEFLFRVPTLRNLPLTGPYFHDGSAATIEDAIRTMGNVQLNRELTDEEVADISAFLNSLVGQQPEVTIPFLPPN